MQSGEKKVWSWGRLKKPEPVPGLNPEDKNVHKKNLVVKIRDNKERNKDFKYQLQVNFASIY